MKSFVDKLSLLNSLAFLLKNNIETRLSCKQGPKCTELQQSERPLRGLAPYQKNLLKQTCCLASDTPVCAEPRKRPPPLPAVHPEASIEHGTSCNATDQASLKLTGTSPLNSALPWTYSPLQPGLTLNNSAQTRCA